MPVARTSPCAQRAYERRLSSASSNSGPGRAFSSCAPRMPAAALEASAPGTLRSSTVARKPRRASSQATAQPMMPPPITRQWRWGEVRDMTGFPRPDHEAESGVAHALSETNQAEQIEGGERQQQQSETERPAGAGR